jgi:hypothetical protein
MTQKSFSELSDQELLDEAHKQRVSPTTNAILIGFLIGILIYSILVNSIGFLSLIPLLMIFMFINKAKKNAELEELLKERKLK